MTDDSIALREFLEKSADAEAADGARGAGPDRLWRARAGRRICC
jgi:hypothetical protein